MKYLNKYNSFGINESDEIKDSDNPKSLYNKNKINLNRNISITLFL